MQNEPLVSVVMPVYNAQRFLAQAVESILNQTYYNFEFLIANDESTDDSLKILEHYAASDARIRHWSRPNAGVVVRLNELLHEARGGIIARMDADDIALPERLERQVAFLLANPDHVVVGSRILVIDPDGDPLCIWCTQQTHEEIDAILIGQEAPATVLCHPATTLRREAVMAVGGYRTEYRHAEDLDLWLRLTECGGRLANLPVVLLKYRVHFSSTSGLLPDRMWERAQTVLQDARRRRGLPNGFTNRSESSARLAGQLGPRLTWGWWALSSGYVSTARKHARYCLTHAPLSMETWRLLYCSARGY
jgi:glycosyltransferase involved in cell wall biosynthesis